MIQILNNLKIYRFLNNFGVDIFLFNSSRRVSISFTNRPIGVIGRPLPHTPQWTSYSMDIRANQKIIWR